MNFEQVLSILTQAGALAIAFGFLYELHQLIVNYKVEEMEEMDRRMAARRRYTQERIAALGRTDVEQLPLLSPALQGIEKTFLNGTQSSNKQESSLGLPERDFIEIPCEICQFIPFDGVNFEYSPIEIPSEEESLR
ncbi:MAG: hypothetical protein GTO18_17995 [Anaerolineales bacterium]|nr:hypothetical protein [Anaerolineales bacterium]